MRTEQKVITRSIDNITITPGCIDRGDPVVNDFWTWTNGIFVPELSDGDIDGFTWDFDIYAENSDSLKFGHMNYDGFDGYAYPKLSALAPREGVERTEELDITMMNVKAQIGHFIYLQIPSSEWKPDVDIEADSKGWQITYEAAGSFSFSVIQTFYSITNNLVGCSKISAVSELAKANTTVIKYQANSGYALPNTVAVTGASYTWNKLTGELILKNPTADITVRINGVPGIVNYNVNFTTNNTLVSRLNKAVVKKGSDAEFYFCAKVGYELPKTINISGCSDFRWDRFWGRLEVTNITGNLTGSINSTAIPYNYEQGSALHNLSIGSTQVSNCFIGNSKVNKMYIGTNLVWDSSPSGLMTSLVPFSSARKTYNHFTVDTGKTAIQIQTILKPLFQKYGGAFLICANAAGKRGIAIDGDAGGLNFNIMKVDEGATTLIAEVSNENIRWYPGFTSNMIQTANFAASFVSSPTSTAPVITIEEAQKVANFIGVDINPEPVTLIQNRSNINNLGVAGFSNDGAPDSVDTYIIADNLKLYRLAWGAEPHTTLKQRPYLTAVDNYDTQDALLGWENKGNRYYLQDEIVTIEGKKYSAWRKYNYADTVMEREPELVNPHNAAFDYPNGVSSAQILLYTNPAKF